MPIRRFNLKKTKQLHPQKDHKKIVYRIACLDFSFDSARAMELAFFRTFAIPSISTILHKTGKFLHATQCRVDDTDILLSEILESGYDAPRGLKAIERINRIHADFDLNNEDMIYVLSTFVIEPQKWLAQFSWRPIHPIEHEALYHFWTEVGRRMHIHNMPTSLEKLVAYNHSYEESHFVYMRENHELAVATRKHLLSHFLPTALQPYGYPLFNAFLDRPLLRACGLEEPPQRLRRLLQQTMRLRSQLSSFRLNTIKHRTEVNIKSYPQGYVINEVGGSIAQGRSPSTPMESS
jgi:hypothetical protein